jgi:hypothetical protein
LGLDSTSSVQIAIGTSIAINSASSNQDVAFNALTDLFNPFAPPSDSSPPFIPFNFSGTTISGPTDPNFMLPFEFDLSGSDDPYGNIAAALVPVPEPGSMTLIVIALFAFISYGLLQLGLKYPRPVESDARLELRQVH